MILVTRYSMMNTAKGDSANSPFFIVAVMPPYRSYMISVDYNVTPFLKIEIS